MTNEQGQASIRYLLERVDIEASYMVDLPPMLTTNLDVDVQRRLDMPGAAIMVSFRTWVVKGVNEGHKGYFEVPATWWDHVKTALFAAYPWAQRVLSPARMRRLEYITDWVCPHMNVAGGDRAHFNFLQHGPAHLRR